MQPKLAFSDTDKEVVAKKGLKIKSKAKELTNEQKRQKQQQKLDDAAEKLVEDVRKRDEEGIVVIQQYVGLLKSKMLESNKGEVGRSLENQIIEQLIELAVKINNDPREDKDGMGSISLISLILKMLLFQRNRLNDLEYKNATLTEELKRLNDKVSELKVK